jgi:ATP-dependent DNA helicase DinG
MAKTVNQPFSLELFLSNFPFENPRPKQSDVLSQIADAWNEGYKTIVLEAPTGFGKGGVALALAKTLGSSYIVSATTELQAQYLNDFPYLRTIIGQSHFKCLVKEDFIRIGTDKCGICGKFYTPNECFHKSVEYGPCKDDNVEYKHILKICNVCKNKNKSSNDSDEDEDDDDYSEDFLDKLSSKSNSNKPNIKSCLDYEFHSGCRYRLWPEDYIIINANTPNEQVVLKSSRQRQYNLWYRIGYVDYDTISEISKSESESDTYLRMRGMEPWTHMKNFTTENMRQEFGACGYFDQLIKGFLASHTILNYSNYQIFLRIYTNSELLVLDEGHLIEDKIIGDTKTTISEKKLHQFIDPYPHFQRLIRDNYDYESSITEKWLSVLLSIEMELSLVIEGRTKDSNNNIKTISKEVLTESKNYLLKVSRLVKEIRDNPDNWIVSALKVRSRFLKEDRVVKNSFELHKLIREGPATRIVSVEFKPLDISKYCKKMFNKCNRTLIMSATITDIDVYCKSIGLDPSTVKYIKTGSDFPVENRPIIPMNTIWLNKAAMDRPDTGKIIAAEIDDIMTEHKNEKGIIHVTRNDSFEFISQHLSPENRKRLICTTSNGDGELSRTGVIERHFKTSEPTVLFSPSLRIGVDLKDDYARFAIIVKVPYLDLNDRWISMKKLVHEKRGINWYFWKTANDLVQMYGRTVRSKDDWSKTYVIDSSFENFVYRNRLPEYFMEAIMN